MGVAAREPAATASPRSGGASRWAGLSGRQGGGLAPCRRRDCAVQRSPITEAIARDRNRATAIAPGRYRTPPSQLRLPDRSDSGSLREATAVATAAQSCWVRSRRSGRWEQQRRRAHGRGAGSAPGFSSFRSGVPITMSTWGAEQIAGSLHSRGVPTLVTFWALEVLAACAVRRADGEESRSPRSKRSHQSRGS